jgi:lipopolysaccharide biosynthesis glycosyltransferase
LLVDLKKWREEFIQDKLLSFISERGGRVTHHDQGVINGVLNNNMIALHPEYNALTPFFTMKYKDLVSFFGLTNYYSAEEIKAAAENPAIVHFTPEFVGRVWERGCKHPKKALYIESLDKTYWKGNIGKGESLPLKLKLLHWLYRNLPVTLMKRVIHLRKK